MIKKPAQITHTNGLLNHHVSPYLVHVYSKQYYNINRSELHMTSRH